MTTSFPARRAKNIRFLARSDQGGRPDGVQVIVHKGHAFIGHMFSDGFTVVDVRDPLNPKTVAFVAAPKNTRSHHLQIAWRHPARGQRPEYLGDAAIRQPAGLLRQVADRLGARPSSRSPRACASSTFRSRRARAKSRFLHMPGFGAHRIWWVGGRYAYVSVHFEGFIDHVLAIVDMSIRPADARRPLVAARHVARRRRTPPAALASARRCIT